MLNCAREAEGERKCCGTDERVERGKASPTKTKMLPWHKDEKLLLFMAEVDNAKDEQGSCLGHAREIERERVESEPEK